MKWLLCVAVSILFSCCLTVVSSKDNHNHQTGPKSEEAYATLLYGDAFLLGVRVLGQSIKDSGSTRDLVVIVTGDVSHQAQHTLHMDGWRIKQVKAVENPGKWTQNPSKKFPQKFWAVYTKLQIFNLTEYKKVVFMDADTIAVKNSDVMFQCPGFCAALRHSERLNSGVMVVTPSAALFSDMMSKIHSMPSYTGGDQGFLNAYFADFANGFVFQPGEDYSKATDKYMRLPTVFNADIGLFVVNSNRWMVAREKIYVFHYTLGPFKPWVWWTSWLVKESDTWEGIRARLPADAAGRRGGRTGKQQLAESWMLVLPLVLLGVVSWYSINLQEVKASWTAKVGLAHNGRGVLPRLFVAQSIAVGYLCLLLALLVVASQVPSEVRPVAGWLLCYEWGLLILIVLYGKYLQYCYEKGKQSSMMITQENKNAVKPWVESLSSTVVVVVALVVSPWFGALVGIGSFVGTVFTTVFAALTANVLLTHSFIMLPVKWYIAGRSEGLAK